MTAPDKPAGPPPNGPDAPAGESSAAHDATLRAAILAVAATAAVLSGGAFALWGSRAGIGVGVGGALATANLIVLARVGKAFISRKGRTSPWAVIAALKLIVLFAGVWLILRSGIASGLTLALGYCALPIGITLGSLFGPKPPELEPGGAAPGSHGASSTPDALGKASLPNAAHPDVLDAPRREAQEPPADSR